MTNSHTQSEDDALRAQKRRDLLLMLGGFAVFVVVALAVVSALNPSLRPAALLGRGGPAGDGSLDLVLMHTNDTLGYTDPCG